MEKKVIAMLFGGQSSEHEVSKSSAKNVLEALSKNYFVLPVYITREGRWYLYDGPKEHISSLNWDKYAQEAILSPAAHHKGILRLVGNKFKIMPIDIVFPVLHGKNGEDGAVQGLLQLAGIPYVGSGILSSAICMDKAITKLVASSLGLAQAPYIVCRKDGMDIDKVEEVLGYPCFVKPANTGSSVGISKAKNREELMAAVDKALAHDNKLVFEAAINGRELECSVLGNDEPIASGIGEITYNAEFYTYEAKYEDSSSVCHIPADVSDDVADEARRMSLEVYKACECKGLARVDFILENDTNKLYFNEINSLPGFTAISMYPKLWEHGGIGIDELVSRLVSLASC